MNELPEKPLTPALVLGFLPAIVALAIGTTSGQNGPSRSVLVGVCVLSLACCFSASFLLFRRRTALAIFGGIALFLINGFISFFAGCLAVVQGMKF